MTIRFDEAWAGAYAIAEDAIAGGADVILVRDLLGRVSLVIDDRAGDVPAHLDERLRTAAGRFIGPNPVLRATTLFDPTAILHAPDLTVRIERADGHGRLGVLERGIVGADWVTPPRRPSSRRVTLYGFKGGVGRSTATFLLAQHLARAGRCVLVVDLDLESPGVGALLVDNDDLPDHGVVDQLVEAAVDNDEGLDAVVRSPRVVTSGNGEVWIAPAAGRPRTGYDYLAKLNRVYSDLSADAGGAPRRFADRLANAVEACERRVAAASRTPEVVLLDSRAGIHDIAAVAITQLSDLSLLFATDNPQTWAGYGALFGQWSRNLSYERRHDIRQRLRMVAALVPPTRRDEYLTLFRDHAQECFADTLYDDELVDCRPGTDERADEPSPFNFSPEDESAPHYPLPITFSTDLVGLDQVANDGWHTSPLLDAAYGDFLSVATQLAFADDAQQ